jgi:hypothetical protein
MIFNILFTRKGNYFDPTAQAVTGWAFSYVL